MSNHRESLKTVFVGHVDHGKSTLVGRLFHDTDSLPDGRVEEIRKMCERRGMPFEYAFLMDALQAERDQGITIDTSQIWFKTQKRDYVIIDAPGHKEFLKNMVSGAASADAAILVVDAKDGVQEQTRRHGYILHLLGLDQVVVAVNKMDLVDHSKVRFDEVAGEVHNYLGSMGITPAAILPVSARHGDGLTAMSDKMPWFEGTTLIAALDALAPKPMPVELPLRFPIQDVYMFDERRILAGRIESGKLNVGDT
ncbi:MAG: GTP-binding protein, partial [Minwuia sp.]|nr:GTP-binding protein [Minwuia sp.]